MAIRGGSADSAYNSSGTTGYIPELFSKKMLINFFEVTLFKSIANTDYQGEISDMGDKVNISTTPTIAISDYVIGDDMNTEVPTSDSLPLTIDQGKYWNYKINDIDKVQTHLNLLNAFASEAGEQMAQVVDTDVLKYITLSGYDTTVLAVAGDGVGPADANWGTAAGAISGDINLGAEFTTVSGDNALAPTVDTAGSTMVDYIIDAGLVLDEQNIPKANRWIVLPAWACAMLKRGDLKRADVTGDSTGVIRNGLIGEVDGMMVYKSNNVYNATESGGTGDDVELFYCPFGVKAGMTFASQLVKSESVRMEKQFGDIFRGLNVFGRAVVQPTSIGMMILKK